MCQFYDFIIKKIPFHKHIIPPNTVLNLSILSIQTTLSISDSISKQANKLLTTLLVQRALALESSVHKLATVGYPFGEHVAMHIICIVVLKPLCSLFLFFVDDSTVTDFALT